MLVTLGFDRVLICLDMSWSLIDVWFCNWLDCKVQSLVLCKSLAPFEHRPCSCTAPVSRWFSVTWRWTWEKDGEGTCSKKAAEFQLDKKNVRCRRSCDAKTATAAEWVLQAATSGWWFQVDFPSLKLDDDPVGGFPLIVWGSHYLDNCYPLVMTNIAMV